MSVALEPPQKCPIARGDRKNGNLSPLVLPSIIYKRRRNLFTRKHSKPARSYGVTEASRKATRVAQWIYTPGGSGSGSSFPLAREEGAVSSRPGEQLRTQSHGSRSVKIKSTRYSVVDEEPPGPWHPKRNNRQHRLPQATAGQLNT